MRVPLPVHDIRRSSHQAPFVEAVRSLYERLDGTIEGHRPTCASSGACCRFDPFGHQLFVTSVELAYFLATADGPLLAPADRSSCPYQVGSRCTARPGRPVGCRVYYCAPGAQSWQPDLTEETLVALRAIGVRFGLEYAYLEWTEALRELGGLVLGSRDHVQRVQLVIDKGGGRS